MLIGLNSFYYRMNDTSQQYSVLEKNTLSKFIDERDNHSYHLIKVNDLIWFNENLSFKTKNSEPINNVSIPNVGRLYSYQDSKIACPEGWRLPLVAEFDSLISEIFKTDYYGQSLNVDFNWKTIAHNQIGFNFNKTGLIHKKKYISQESFNIWLDNNDNDNAFHAHMYDTSQKENSLTVFRHNHRKHKPKKNRKFAIRCVCEDSTQQ